MKVIKYLRVMIDQRMSFKRLKSLMRLYSEDEIHRCVICGGYTLGLGYICKRCGWECDPCYEDEDDWDDDSAANHTTVNYYREIYRRVGKGHPIEDYWEEQRRDAEESWKERKGCYDEY